MAPIRLVLIAIAFFGGTCCGIGGMLEGPHGYIPWMVIGGVAISIMSAFVNVHMDK